MYKITELQIYEAKADNKRETDKCSIQRDRLRTFQNSERHQATDSEFQQAQEEINTQKTT